MMPQTVRNIILFVSAVLLVASSALYIADNEALHTAVLYVYAVSGALIAVEILSNPYRGENLRLKRLNVQQTIAALLLPFSSYLMFKGKNEWFMFLLIAVFLILYVTFVRSSEEKKEKQSIESEHDNERPE
ncbi:MAG: hypothetical protein LBR64_00875 [Dysgonamonadaceae bacterium]|jgi:uncharacterized membrane protein|nr:hypothetical protein [Dysgonamonadaceae bacterium]